MSFLNSRTTTWVAGGVALLAAASLAGCSASASPSGDASSAATATPVSGGVVTIDTPSDEDCADPHQLNGRSLLIAGRAELDSLLFLNSDGEIEPWLASSYEVSADATTYTFHLRDDVTFSDGSKLTSTDVQATFDAVKALGAKAKAASTWFSTYVGTTTPDASTAVVTFSAGDAAFLNQVTTASLGIMSQASAAKSSTDLCTDGDIGTGPFTFASAPYVANAGFTLKARDDYDWAPASEHQGRPYLDEVDFQIVADSSARAKSVISGAADLTTEINLPDLSILGDLPVDVRANPGVVEGLFVNVKGGGVLADQAVRTALQTGIDRQTIIAKTQIPQYTPVPTSVLSKSTPGYADESQYMTFDAAAAEQTLDAAGWVVGADGIRAKDGQRLTLSLMYASARYQANLPMLQLVQAGYKALGIEITLRPVPDADETAIFASGDYQLRIAAQTLPDPSVLDLAFKTQDDATLNGLDAQAIASGDVTARNGLVAQAQQHIIQTGLFVPIRELALPTAHSEDVKDFVFEGDSLLLLTDLWKTS